MEKDLHKRLEEAAKEYADKKFPKHRASENDRREREDYQLCRDSYIKGAEFGYKEVVKVAKEWMLQYLPTPDWYSSTEEFVSDFETEMNKLWEEQK